LLLSPNVRAFSFHTSQWTGIRCPLKTTQPTIPPSPMSLCRQSYTSRSTATRLFSTAENITQKSSTNNEEGDHLLDPYDILRNLQKGQTNTQDAPKIPLPTHLSPTSLEQYHKCPQAFFFLYILKLTRDPPMTPQLARGIICHTALEEVFDLSPDDRSLANLENLFRRGWGKVRGHRGKDSVNLNKTKTKKEDYNCLFREEREDGSLGHAIDEEIEWGRSSLDLLSNYYDLEDPCLVKSPNPLMREMWVQARFPFGNSADTDEFVVRGKIDRIDVLPSSPDGAALQIIDYKTGKKPWLKYSPKVNDRIEQEQFWKMKVYALMLWKMILRTDQSSAERSSVDYGHEQGRQKDLYKFGLSWALQQRLAQAMSSNTQNNARWSDTLQLNSLRLMYLTSHIDDVSANGDSTMVASGRSSGIGKAKYLDYSLGSSPSEFQSILDQTELEVQTIARNIKTSVDAQSPHAFEHCDWRYCSCHELRRKFRPGSVYQSPDLDY